MVGIHEKEDKEDANSRLGCFGNFPYSHCLETMVVMVVY